MYHLPTLSFTFDAFEPIISKEIMELHYTKHHQAYLDNLNTIIQKYDPQIFENFNETTLAMYINAFPNDIRQDLRNALGGHVNHSFFWSCLSNHNTQEYKNKLEGIFAPHFGSVDKAITALEETGKKFFGSGWVWITVNPLNGSLDIRTYTNQDNPLFENLYPLLGIDLWEHSYYLQYKNNKNAYLKEITKLINWKYVYEFYQSLTGEGEDSHHQQCCGSC
jgi:Fe-Mn family superoxide dismutase